MGLGHWGVPSSAHAEQNEISPYMVDEPYGFAPTKALDFNTFVSNYQEEMACFRTHNENLKRQKEEAYSLWARQGMDAENPDFNGLDYNKPYNECSEPYNEYAQSYNEYSEPYNEYAQSYNEYPQANAGSSLDFQDMSSSEERVQSINKFPPKQSKNISTIKKLSQAPKQSNKKSWTNISKAGSKEPSVKAKNAMGQLIREKLDEMVQTRVKEICGSMMKKLQLDGRLKNIEAKQEIMENTVESLKQIRKKEEKKKKEKDEIQALQRVKEVIKKNNITHLTKYQAERLVSQTGELAQRNTTAVFACHDRCISNNQRLLAKGMGSALAFKSQGAAFACYICPCCSRDEEMKASKSETGEDLGVRSSTTLEEFQEGVEGSGRILAIRFTNKKSDRAIVRRERIFSLEVDDSQVQMNIIIPYTHLFLFFAPAEYLYTRDTVTNKVTSKNPDASKQEGVLLEHFVDALLHLSHCITNKVNEVSAANQTTAKDMEKAQISVEETKEISEEELIDEVLKEEEEKDETDTADENFNLLDAIRSGNEYNLLDTIQKYRDLNRRCRSRRRSDSNKDGKTHLFELPKIVVVGSEYWKPIIDTLLPVLSSEHNVPKDVLEKMIDEELLVLSDGLQFQ